MKSINDWKRERILETFNLNEWYEATNENNMPSFNDWRLKKAINAILDEQAPNPLGNPDPEAIPGQPPNPQFNVPPPGGPEGQPSMPPQPGPEGAPPAPEGAPEAPPPEGQPTGPMGGDDKALMSSLQPILGDKPKDALPVSTALKMEAKKAKEKAAHGKSDSGTGLKTWLWLCLDAWMKTKVSLPQPDKTQGPPGPPPGPPSGGPPPGPPSGGPPPGPPSGGPPPPPGM